MIWKKYTLLDRFGGGAVLYRGGSAVGRGHPVQGGLDLTLRARDLHLVPRRVLLAGLASEHAHLLTEGELLGSGRPAGLLQCSLALDALSGVAIHLLRTNDTRCRGHQVAARRGTQHGVDVLQGVA